MDRDEAERHREQLPDWEIAGEPRCDCAGRFGFQDFQQALDFARPGIGDDRQSEPSGAGDAASAGATWGLEIRTRRVDGLHENDFILAAKIDAAL
ncbi:MAG: 4a-hydroxytetrahydrobiopterin dehydratase [Arhodomonas sp.]|nr:4a-hydroxytetrahydrobiopterin dehydratase [Arhodomonas sp.]